MMWQSKKHANFASREWRESLSAADPNDDKIILWRQRQKKQVNRAAITVNIFLTGPMEVALQSFGHQRREFQTLTLLTQRVRHPENQNGDIAVTYWSGIIQP
jgi:hypothetical protein